MSKALATRSGAPATPLTSRERDASDTAIDLFVTALGGQDQVTAALAVAADQPEVDRVVTLLLDPRYAGYSLKRLCHLAGLTVVDLFAAYKSAMIVQAHLQAYQAITATLLPVVQDVMRRAAPHEVPCHDCGGSGTVETSPGVSARCGQCAGHGKLLQLPDLDRQKLALELGQLVQKAGGLNISQQTVVQAASDKGALGTGSLVDLQLAAREILRGPRTPILDVEPTEAAPPEG